MENLVRCMDTPVGSTRSQRGGVDLEPSQGDHEGADNGLRCCGLLLRSHKCRTVIGGGEFEADQKRLPTNRS